MPLGKLKTVSPLSHGCAADDVIRGVSPPPKTQRLVGESFCAWFGDSSVAKEGEREQVEEEEDEEEEATESGNLRNQVPPPALQPGKRENGPPITTDAYLCPADDYLGVGRRRFAYSKFKNEKEEEENRRTSEGGGLFPDLQPIVRGEMGHFPTTGA